MLFKRKSKDEPKIVLDMENHQVVDVTGDESVIILRLKDNCQMINGIWLMKKDNWCIMQNEYCQSNIEKILELKEIKQHLYQASKEKVYV